MGHRPGHIDDHTLDIDDPVDLVDHHHQQSVADDHHAVDDARLERAAERSELNDAFEFEGHFESVPSGHGALRD